MGSFALCLTVHKIGPNWVSHQPKPDMALVKLKALFDSTKIYLHE